jgi:hypothetical protein
MKPAVYASVILATFGLVASACSTVEPSGESEPEYRQRVVPTDPSEPYYHSASNVVFPQFAGIFSRTGVSSYDPDSLDVSGHYVNELLSAIATTYFYPGTGNPQLEDAEVMEHYEGLKQGIEASHPGAELLSENSGTFSVNDSPTNGLHAVYHLFGIGDSQEEMESHFFLFPFGAWYLKFRITYPLGARTDAILQVQPFLDANWWESSAT